MLRNELEALLETLRRPGDAALELNYVLRPRNIISPPQIYVSRDFLEQPDDWLRGWLLHEIEHRRCLPGTIETQLFWSYIVTRTGLREPTRLIHFYCDLAIDNLLLSARPAEYREFLRNRASTLSYLEEDQRATYLEVIDALSKDAEPSSEKGKVVFEAICKGANDHENRLKALSNILTADFRGTTPFTTDIQPNLKLNFTERDNLTRYLLASGAVPTQVQEFFDTARISMTESEARQVLMTATRLYMHHFVEAISPILRGHRVADFPILEIWNPGDDPRELSLVDTIRLYGILVPGVFAVKRREVVRGRRAKAITVLMDCSGSTALTQTLSREREAAFGLVQAARQRSDIVSFIPFSTDVHMGDAILYSRDYDGMEEAIIKVQPSGFSNITAPLSLALKVADIAGRQVAFVMTDGRVWDSEQALGMINSLTEYGKIIFFIFGTGVTAMPEEAKQLLRGSVVYECDPKEPIVEQALHEYLG